MKTVTKIICAAFVLVMICASVVPFSARTVNGIVGDADGNGTVTIMDATRIQRTLVGLYHDDDHITATFGDTDGRGLTIMDATRIQRYLAGFTVNAPIGQPKSAEIADPTEAPTEEPTKKDPYELPLVD